MSIIGIIIAPPYTNASLSGCLGSGLLGLTGLPLGSCSLFSLPQQRQYHSVTGYSLCGVTFPHLLQFIILIGIFPP